MYVEIEGSGDNEGFHWAGEVCNNLLPDIINELEESKGVYFITGSYMIWLNKYGLCGGAGQRIEIR